MINRQRRNSVLLLFSDVSSSPQLIEILKQLRSKQTSFHVILIGDSKLKISSDMRSLNIPFTLITKRSKYRSLPMILSVIGKMLRSRPEVVFVSGQYATVIGIFSAYVLKVPRRIFIRHHSNFHHKYDMQFGVWIDRLANRLSTGIVAVSQVVQRVLVNVEDVNPSKIKLIQNGIELVKYRESVPKTSFVAEVKPDPHQTIQIGIISRLTEWKGVIYSVDAFIRFHVEFPNSHLRIIGAHADSFKMIAERLSTIEPSSYTLSEWESDVLGFLNGLDIFIHVPIGPEEEAFGLVYIEALAADIPCIFTMSGVLHELPNPERYAEIVPYADSDAIHDSMVKILRNTSPTRNSVSPEWLEQFSIDVMADRYLRLILGESANESK